MLKLTLRVVVILMGLLSGLIFVTDQLGTLRDTSLIYFTDGARENLYVWDAILNQTVYIAPSVPEQANISRYAISHDDGAIAILTDNTERLDNQFDYSRVIYLADSDGTNVRELLNIGIDEISGIAIEHIYWSPDGNYIGILTESIFGFGVWIVTPDGTLITRYTTLPPLPDGTANSRPNPDNMYTFSSIGLAWSSDSSQLYVIGFSSAKALQLNCCLCQVHRSKRLSIRISCALSSRMRRYCPVGVTVSNVCVSMVAIPSRMIWMSTVCDPISTNHPIACPSCDQL